MNLLPPFPISRPEGDVWVTLQAVIEDGVKIAGIYKLDGKINAPPKAWLAVVREELVKIEGIAREAGCDELRLQGRDWSRVLPDYEPIYAPTLRNGLRKRLT